MRESHGVVVEASIVARLLRIRLLRLDATVVVLPADVAEPLPQPSPARPPPRRELGGPSTDGRPRLAEAVRAIEESAAILARTRRAGGRVSAGLPPAPRQRG
ncbi:MAG TPA: hypothetical protein VFS37_15550 [Conexibacter sp.]|nr:hypothetical protein [Conexibacter sp.]